MYYVKNENNWTNPDFMESMGSLYEKHSLPPTIGNESRVVKLTVGIRSISDISEMESSLTVQYLMAMEWYDERLKFKPFIENNKLKNYITLSGNVLKEKGNKLQGQSKLNDIQNNSVFFRKMNTSTLSIFSYGSIHITARVVVRREGNVFTGVCIYVCPRGEGDTPTRTKKGQPPCQQDPDRTPLPHPNPPL